MNGRGVEKARQGMKVCFGLFKYVSMVDLRWNVFSKSQQHTAKRIRRIARNQY